VKFLVDMPLSPALASWLAEQGHDAVHASNVGLALAPDEAILARARSEHRLVITADLDFSRLIALAEAEEPGLILFRGGDWSEAEAQARLGKALNSVSERELARSIVVIERTRIRRRGLPVR
jgi:predicted nuclease of predicted toxin-antitoxin system